MGDQGEKPRRPKMKTSCHDCRGNAWVPIATMVRFTGSPVTGTQFGQKPCKTCDGKGTLRGLVPPM